MMKKFKQITKPGNPILYRLHQVFNGLYGVSGAGLIAATIWLANLLGHYTYINGIFVGLGILELILFIAVFLAKKSVTKYDECYYFQVEVLCVCYDDNFCWAASVFAYDLRCGFQDGSFDYSGRSGSKSIIDLFD